SMRSKPLPGSGRGWRGPSTSISTGSSRWEGWAEVATTTRKRPPEEPTGPGAIDFTIITGLSGAGRSEAAKCFEALGYFVVDNLPPALIGKMAELAAASGTPARVAIVADVRGGVFFSELSRGLQDLKQLKIPYRILFLEASDD